MKRAAVIIGIDQTGDLPKLKDAARGARLVEEWARAQQMNPVHVFTDAAGPVDVAAIKKAIKGLVDAANISQLVVYFAGHGVNRQRHEYWLLSDAPDDTQAAVNVAGSAALAATCGIPHTIFISDACRTAAEGIRAQSTTGSEIFPNREDAEKPVDQFFACQLGRPSHELKDPQITSAEFRALYTGELVPALRGRRPEIIEWTIEGSEEIGLIRLRALRDCVSSAVAARLGSLNLQSKVIQEPFAQIVSDPPAWISRVSRRDVGGGPLGFGLPAPAARPPIETAATVTSSLLQRALTQDTTALSGALADGRTSGVSGAVELVDSAERIAQPFGPTHHETQCGFKIRGGQIVEALSNSATLEILNAFGPPGEVVRVNSVAHPGSTVLLVLAQGVGVVLPAIPEFLAALTIEDGELVDVAYEPSDNSWRWSEYSHRLGELRALRAIIAASMTRGTFRLERADALSIAKQMQYAKGIDPSLAIYAAYGYHGLGRSDLIHDMCGYLSSDLGAPLFDVAMLSRRLKGQTVGRQTNVLSPIPLLSQGWALLSAFGVKLAPSLEGLQNMITASLWTMLDARGVERVKRAMASGDIR